MTAAIDIRNVTKRYGGLTVLDDISLSVSPGEFLVFLGPSGCGKSTLLRMIAGLESLDAGQIDIGGQRIDALPPGQRGVAMVFQSYALYPHMTVAQNMGFGLANIGTPKAEIARRIDTAAEVLEIRHLLDRKPAQLSGGQRQRVAIGRAIVKEPKAFLFDEPLSNLDAALRGRTRIELAQLHKRLRATMIFVTHDQVEAMTLADRIVIMNNRVIEQIGTPIEIYRRPATRFVAGFVGAPAMNFLPVTSLSSQGGLAVAEVGGAGLIPTSIPLPPAPADGMELGIRAEDLRPTEGPADFHATVEIVERLGDRTLLYATLDNGTPVVAEASGRSTITGGDRVPLALDRTALHLFDATGKAHHSEAG